MSVLGANKELWVTKARDVVDVDTMTEVHAKNTLKMLIRQIREGKLTQLGYHQERINKARFCAVIDGYFEEDKNKRLRELNAIVSNLAGGTK